MINNIYSYKPDILKRVLLLVAGFVWLILSYLFIHKSYYYLLENSHHILFHIQIGFASGIIIFLIFFMNISRKFTFEVIEMDCEKYCFLSYTNIKIYFITALLIGISFYLKKTNFINHLNLSIALIGIGVSLLFASLRFFYYFFTFKKLTNNKNN